MTVGQCGMDVVPPPPDSCGVASSKWMPGWSSGSDVAPACQLPSAGLPAGRRRARREVRPQGEDVADLVGVIRRRQADSGPFNEPVYGARTASPSVTLPRSQWATSTGASSRPAAAGRGEPPSHSAAATPASPEAEAPARASSAARSPGCGRPCERINPLLGPHAMRSTAPMDAFARKHGHRSGTRKDDLPVPCEGQR